MSVVKIFYLSLVKENIPIYGVVSLIIRILKYLN